MGCHLLSTFHPDIVVDVSIICTQSILREEVVELNVTLLLSIDRVLTNYLEIVRVLQLADGVAIEEKT